jgi:hypothetical protein
MQPESMMTPTAAMSQARRTFELTNLYMNMTMVSGAMMMRPVPIPPGAGNRCSLNKLLALGGGAKG